LKIDFAKSPFTQPVTDLLREMGKTGFFSHGLLIGSWPMQVYCEFFTISFGLVTYDIDFAINVARVVHNAPNDMDFAVNNVLQGPATRPETIPQVLERLGYSSVMDYTGIETFIQETFEVEFITHRRGGVAPPSVIIPHWGVSAQPLPFIDLLFIRPVTVSIEDFAFRIPSPEALMLHKLIIAQRRTGRDKELKKEKDLQQCSVLAEIVRNEETLQITSEYRLSKDAKKSISASCEAIGIPVQSLGI